MSNSSPSPTDLKQELLNVLDAYAKEMWVPDLPLRARLERATITEPEPTDQELREALRRELGYKWKVWEAAEDGWLRAEIRNHPSSSRLSLDALRAPNGVKRVAEALKVLAGESVE